MFNPNDGGDLVKVILETFYPVLQQQFKLAV
jgi:hypothetical protein